MGPRGHRLHCTKRHFWVLKWSLCQEGKTGKDEEKWWYNVFGNWVDNMDVCDISQVSHLLPAAKSSQRGSLTALWCFCIYTTREGRHEQAALQTGQSNTNQFIPFLWKKKTCSHLMFVTVSVLLPFLCLFTHSLFVMCFWYVLVYIALNKVRVWMYSI